MGGNLSPTPNPAAALNTAARTAPICAEFKDYQVRDTWFGVRTPSG
jgi:hypothetical protein